MSYYDCLIIGHNEMIFSEYEQAIRKMGQKSPTYRDLNLNFINYNGTIYNFPDYFNAFFYGNQNLDNTMGPMNMGNVFSSTIAYLGTYLQRRGLSFDYINSFQYEKECLIQALQHNEYLTIVIPTTFYVSVFPILEIMNVIKLYNASAKVIIGGPFIATQIRTQSEEAVNYMFESINADFYVNNSQGEETLVKLINAIKNGNSYNNINNIIYKNGMNFVKRPVIQEKNQLSENVVDWSLFRDQLNKFAAVRTSISCAFSCSFCGFPEHAGEYQCASVESIERELNSIESTGKITCVNFIDDTFNIPKERFKDLLRMMIRNKYSFKWHCFYRCQFADEETIHLMKEAGCEGVILGIESGSDMILKNMNKSASVSKYKEGIRLLKEAGIITYGSFIIGFPGETIETVNETVNFIKECKPDFFRTQLWYCNPFTPIWKRKDEFEIKNSQFEWSHATMDAHIACDIVDELFQSIEDSIWVPQYGFEIHGLFNLLHRGIELEQCKAIFRAFNQGIKEKLRNPECEELTEEKFKLIQSGCKFGNDNDEVDSKDEMSDSSLDFEFDF